MVKKIDTNEKLQTLFTAIEEKKGVNVTAFDVKEHSGFTDVMVFVTGTSVQHNKTLAEWIQRTLRKAGFAKPLTEGSDRATWILIDAGDIVCHVMLEEVRHYYDLESVWSSSKRIDIVKKDS